MLAPNPDFALDTRKTAGTVAQCSSACNKRYARRGPSNPHCVCKPARILCRPRRRVREDSQQGYFGVPSAQRAAWRDAAVRRGPPANEATRRTGSGCGEAVQRSARSTIQNDVLRPYVRASLFTDFCAAIYDHDRIQSLSGWLDPTVLTSVRTNGPHGIQQEAVRAFTCNLLVCKD